MMNLDVSEMLAIATALLACKIGTPIVTGFRRWSSSFVVRQTLSSSEFLAGAANDLDDFAVKLGAPLTNRFGLSSS